MLYTPTTQGFIAVTTSLILMSVTVAILFSAGAMTYFARMDAAGSEGLDRIDGYARSCLQVFAAQMSTTNDQAATMDTFDPADELAIMDVTCTGWDIVLGQVTSGGFVEADPTSLPGGVATGARILFAVEKNGFINYEAIIQIARDEVPESYTSIVSLKRK